MSLETWKPVAYPIPAWDVPVDQAAAHSLNKWEHMRLPVLQEHGLHRSIFNMSLIDEHEDRFYVNAITCALCVHHEMDDCRTCPLHKVLGKRCDRGMDSPYQAWVDRGDPEPMIAALQKVVEMEKGQA